MLRPVKGQAPFDETVARELAKTVAVFDREGPVQVEARRLNVARNVRWPGTIPPALRIGEAADFEPVLPESLQEAFDQIVLERERIPELLEHRLSPVSKLLLVGPPGVGKSLSASYLARRLDVPLATIDPATVMSSLLGESARNLREALDWGRQNRAVLFIDEFDAFAKRRDDKTDVGELKRLVTMLLLELDNWPPNQLLVAATNHPELLDTAVMRRFDVVEELPLPQTEARHRLILSLAKHHRIEISDKVAMLIASVTDGESGSDLTQRFEGSLRKSLLRGTEFRRELLKTVAPPMSKSRTDTAVRAEFCRVAHDEIGLTNREVAELIDVSAASVSDLIRTARENSA